MSDHSKLRGSKGEGENASLLEGKGEESKQLMDRMMFIGGLIEDVSLSILKLYLLGCHHLLEAGVHLSCYVRDRHERAPLLHC